MSEDLEDKDSKTEEPTEKKLREAVEKGQTINSKEILNFFILTSLLCCIIWILPYSINKITFSLQNLISNSSQVQVNKFVVGDILLSLINKSLIYLSPVFILLILATIFATFIQQGEITFATETIIPKLEKISLLKGFKRIFSMNSES